MTEQDDTRSDARTARDTEPLVESLRALAQELKEHRSAMRSLSHDIRVVLGHIAQATRKYNRDEIEAALKVNRGNVSRSALALNTHRRQLQRYLVRYGLRPAEYKDTPVAHDKRATKP
jgi:transcriptional regulator with GAF, ATPase, and Fis domain